MLSDKPHPHEIRFFERMIYAWNQRIRPYDVPKVPGQTKIPASPDFKWLSLGYIDVEIKGPEPGNIDYGIIRNYIKDKVRNSKRSGMPIRNFVIDLGEDRAMPNSMYRNMSRINVDNYKYGNPENPTLVTDELGILRIWIADKNGLHFIRLEK